MAKANKKELEALHKLLAEYYTEVLGSGEEVSSGTLAAINTFLKNNDVKMDVVESNSLQNLSTRIQDMIKQEA